MTKWADYLISEVAYDSERQIISLKRHKDADGKIGPGEIIDKATVASDIDNGISYMTIFGTLSNWKLGEKIRSSRVDNYFCLRIDDNKVKHDNLGPILELPSAQEDVSKIISKKPSEQKSVISPQDKAMLKNMGARQYDSIKSIPTKSEETVPSFTTLEDKTKSKDDILSEYEKDYLARLENESGKISTETDSLESPHGTLPKGFDESTKEHKPEPESKPEEIPESPHGTLPKIQESKTKQDDRKIVQTYDEQSKELTDLEKQIGDLKKAVDELDESKNVTSKSSNENNSKLQAYCVKCKSKRDIKNPIQSELKNGRPAIKGTCSVCETRVCRIGKMK